MKKEKTERELLADIDAKLNKVVGLLAIQQHEGDENAKLRQLVALELDAPSIAALLGLTVNAVNVRKSRLKGKSRQTSS